MSGVRRRITTKQPARRRGRRRAGYRFIELGDPPSSLRTRSEVSSICMAHCMAHCDHGETGMCEADRISICPLLLTAKKLVHVPALRSNSLLAMVLSARWIAIMCLPGARAS